MPTIPLDVDDEVLYTIRKVYLSRDTSVTIQTRLDFWGTVFFNGSPIANIGAIPMATQAQAEAGTDNSTVMSPLRTAQAITVQAKPAVLNGSGGGTTNFFRADGSWVAPPSTSIPDGDKGDITVSSGIWTIDSGVVTNAKQANMSGQTIKANSGGSPAPPQDLPAGTIKNMLAIGNVDNTSDANKPVSTAQAAADALKADKTLTIVTTAPLTGGGDLSANRTLDISVFTTTVKGAVPPPATVTGAYLKDDGTWSTPAGGGAGVTDGDKGDIVVSASGATWMLDSTVVTSAAKTVLDDVSVAAMLTTLGGVGLNNPQTLTQKTLSLGNNFIDGTSSEFNDACLDTNFFFVTGGTLTGGVTISSGGLTITAGNLTSVAAILKNGGVFPTFGNQILIGQGANYNHAISSAHNASVVASNAMLFKLWQPGDGMSAPSNIALTLAGDAITAAKPVLLPSQPAAANEATRKDYVDNKRYTAIRTIATTTYTLAQTDEPQLLQFTAGTAVTFTIPPNSTVPWPVAAYQDFYQNGAGQVSVAAGAGVTIIRTPSLNLRAQGSAASIIKVATDTWLLTGDLA